jgi:hypothetical protein
MQRAHHGRATNNSRTNNVLLWVFIGTHGFEPCSSLSSFGLIDKALHKTDSRENRKINSNQTVTTQSGIFRGWNAKSQPVQVGFW